MHCYPPRDKLRSIVILLEEFGNVITRGGAGVVIASQSGHRLAPLSAEQNAAQTSSWMAA